MFGSCFQTSSILALKQILFFPPKSWYIYCGKAWTGSALASILAKPVIHFTITGLASHITFLCMSVYVFVCYARGWTLRKRPLSWCTVDLQRHTIFAAGSQQTHRAIISSCTNVCMKEST